MTQLITPAKSHDNKYPKPTPDYPKSNPNEQSNNKVVPYLSESVEFDPSVGGDLTLPEGSHIAISTPFESTINNIFITERNFHPTSGFCMVTLSTDSQYQGDGGYVSFILPNNNEFTLQLTAGKTYFLLIALIDMNGSNLPRLIYSKVE